MPKKKKPSKNVAGWSQRVKLTPEESLKRMEEFPKRREQFITAIRKGKNRGLSA
jgi:hypothetical protein